MTARRAIPTPPRTVERLLAWCLPPGIVRVSILGDLRQEFDAISKTQGRGRATRWYYTQSLTIGFPYLGRRLRPRAHTRPRRHTRWVDTTAVSVRLAARRLARQPVFTGVAVLTLGVGIGGTMAVYTVLQPILIDPLPYAESHRIAVVHEMTERGAGRVTVGDLQRWREGTSTFERLAGYRPGTFNMTGIGTPTRLEGLYVTGDFLDVLGITVALGRPFAHDEEEPGHPRTVIVAHTLWQTLFHADASVVGQSVTLDGEQHTIIGVLPRSFVFSPEIAVLVPTGIDREFVEPERTRRTYHAIGRLKSGTAVTVAQSELSVMSNALTAVGRDEPGLGPVVQSLREEWAGSPDPASPDDAGHRRRALPHSDKQRGRVGNGAHLETAWRVRLA